MKTNLKWNIKLTWFCNEIGNSSKTVKKLRNKSYITVQWLLRNWEKIVKITTNDSEMILKYL